MDAFFKFIKDYEVAIYLIFGVAGLFSLRGLVSGWLEWRAALFGLEREFAFNKIRSSGVILIILAMFALSQFCFVSFVIPFFPSTTFAATPTANLLGQNSVDGEEMTALPALPPEGSVGCIPGQLVISSPTPNEEIKGKITIKGTINIENFGFYKYEYSAGNDLWVTVAAGDKVVIDGDLGNWDLTQLTPGDYQLRLLVTDNTGNALPPCSLPVKVRAE